MPRICFVNKMDRTGADFWRTVDMIIERLGAKPVPIQIPIGSRTTFRGVIDLVEHEGADSCATTPASTVDETEIPAELLDEAQRRGAST